MSLSSEQLREGNTMYLLGEQCCCTSTTTGRSVIQKGSSPATTFHNFSAQQRFAGYRFGFQGLAQAVRSVVAGSVVAHLDSPSEALGSQ